MCDTSALLARFKRDGWCVIPSVLSGADVDAFVADIQAEISGAADAPSGSGSSVPGGSPDAAAARAAAAAAASRGIDLKAPGTWPAGSARRVIEVAPLAEGSAFRGQATAAAAAAAVSPSGASASTVAAASGAACEADATPVDAALPPAVLPHWRSLLASERLNTVLDELIGKDAWELPLNRAARPGETTMSTGIGAGLAGGVRHWYAPVVFPEQDGAVIAAAMDAARSMAATATPSVATTAGASDGVCGAATAPPASSPGAADLRRERDARAADAADLKASTAACGTSACTTAASSAGSGGASTAAAAVVTGCSCAARGCSGMRTALNISCFEEVARHGPLAPLGDNAAWRWQPVNRRRWMSRGWHIDSGPGFPNTALRTLAGEPRNGGAVVLIVLSDWLPGGGGTAMINGSHKWVAAELRRVEDLAATTEATSSCTTGSDGASAPAPAATIDLDAAIPLYGSAGTTHEALNTWTLKRLRGLTDAGRVKIACHCGCNRCSGGTAASYADGSVAAAGTALSPLHCDPPTAAPDVVMEGVCARAGDVVLFHPWLLHSGCTNLQPAARIMINGMARLKAEHFAAHGSRVLKAFT